MGKAKEDDEEKAGYKFKGYYDDEFFSKKVEGENGYPLYIREKYKITYKLKKGKNDSLNPKHYYYGTEVNLVAPTRTHYKFAGWYRGDKKVEKIEKNDMGNIILEAKWIHELALIEEKGKKPGLAYFETYESKIKYVSDMCKTQLEYFALFEAKNTTLATVDAILLTLASLFTSAVILENKGALPSFHRLVVSILLIALVLIILSSLVVTLLNTIFDVGKRRRRFLKIQYNHHSISGLIHYSKKEFIDRINKISAEEVFLDLANQTRGLVGINEKNQKRIKAAVILDLIALLLLIGILIYIVVVQNVKC